jgi:molecular chaperone DnaJ
MMRAAMPESPDSRRMTSSVISTSTISSAACGGTGQKIHRERRGGVSFQQIAPCPDCDGCGTIIDTPCPECAGSGQTRRDEVLSVRIPVGVEEGTALRIPCRGLPAEKPGQPPGDLLVIVRTGDDPRFQRRDCDLYRVEAVGLVDAVLGGTIEVPGLEGLATVKLPAGTQSDSLLRLRGKGLPRFGNGRRGDLYIQIKVRIPGHLSTQQRRLFEQLRALEQGSHESVRQQYQA